MRVSLDIASIALTVGLAVGAVAAISTGGGGVDRHTACTALAAGANMWFNVYYPPEGTKAWITYAFGAVGIVMAAFGTRFAMMPAAMVRSITVLPAATKAGAGSSSSPAAKAAAAASQPVLLVTSSKTG